MEEDEVDCAIGGRQTDKARQSAGDGHDAKDGCGVSLAFVAEEKRDTEGLVEDAGEGM